MLPHLICCVLTLGLAWSGEVTPPPPPASLGTTTDRPIRFVNNHVITQGDVQRQNAIRMGVFRKTGRVLPETDGELLRFCNDSLEDLTDETLLIQKAEELKVSINRDRLASEVVAEARSSGYLLRDMAIFRTLRERKLKMDAVLEWYERRAALVSPSEIEAYYNEHRAEFTRPSRAKALMYALHPTAPDERQALVTYFARLMRVAQSSTNDAVKLPATSRLEAYLAADLPGQEQILIAIASDLAALAANPDLNQTDREIVGEAAPLLKRWQGVRTRAQCEVETTAFRTEIAALPMAQRQVRFRERTKAESQGPHAVDGGDLGWVETKTYGQDIEDQILALPAGEVSAPFWTGGSVAVVLVLEREEGRTQEFAEVSSLLQHGLQMERQDLVRRRVVAVLRAQSSIKDLVALKDILR
ncbi:MAG: peptidylprolyl isomerase [Planctomycetota bacterium]